MFPPQDAMPAGGFQYPTDHLLPLQGTITDDLMRNPDMWVVAVHRLWARPLMILPVTAYQEEILNKVRRDRYCRKKTYGLLGCRAKRPDFKYTIW